MKTRQDKLYEWYKSETERDEQFVEKTKSDLIKNLQGIKKDDIFPKVQKMTIWQRIRKVLNF
jgi:hypothetical protein